ncbi:MAG TPA: hypothetical protein VGS78_00060 [Candidatus Sulfotelmatobacter sp.]|nr:hypothetical protein [Candidatus Sulfotelmatobacter sp.]
MIERLKGIPWTPLLLLALLVSNCANWIEIRRVQRGAEEWGWDSHYIQSNTSSTIEAMNDRLKEISNNSENTSRNADCLKAIRPPWCKP